MGVDYNLFIGPYIKAGITSNLVTKTAKLQKFCAVCHQSDRKPLTEKFCNQCGLELVERKVGEAVTVDRFYSYDQTPPCDDLIIDVNVDDNKNQYFIANGNDMGGLYLDPKTDLGVVADKPDVDADIKKFTEKEGMPVVLEMLRKHFGAENIEIKWGVILWCS